MMILDSGLGLCRRFGPPQKNFDMTGRYSIFAIVSVRNDILTVPDFTVLRAAYRLYH